jgi:leucyl aminopeptidase (aminopeptidase T)
MATADQRHMRFLRTGSVLVLGVLGGCLELEHTVTLAANGSGKQVVRMTIRDSTIADVERAKAATEGAAGAGKVLFDKELVARELTAAGLALESHNVQRKERQRTVDLAATFPTFAVLQKSPLAGSRAEWVLAAGPKEGTAKLTLYPQGKAAWTEARARAEAMQEKADEVADAFFRKKQQELAGLDLTVRFQLPGDVLVWTANMEKTGAREVTARITADQIKTPQDLVRRLAPRYEVVFDSTGCSLPLQ